MVMSLYLSLLAQDFADIVVSVNDNDTYTDILKPDDQWSCKRSPDILV